LSEPGAAGAGTPHAKTPEHGPALSSRLAIGTAGAEQGPGGRASSPGREAVERARELGDEVLLGESLTGSLHCYALTDPAHAGPLFAEAIAGPLRAGDHLFAYHLTNGVQLGGRGLTRARRR
jgi:hypothetical protein